MIGKLILLALAAPFGVSASQVSLKQGTYTGVNLPSFKQDLFLGIPYAK
jgi:hypothetical protein